MKAAASVEGQAIQQHCKLLRLPTVDGQFQALAQQATQEKRTHVGYLEALLSAEVEEREQRRIQRRLKEARLPQIKTLEEFDFAESKKVSAAEMAQLAEGESTPPPNRPDAKAGEEPGSQRRSEAALVGLRSNCCTRAQR